MAEVTGVISLVQEVAAFTLIVDHEDGASSFTQVEADSVRRALIEWAQRLDAPPWEGFSEEQRGQILNQIDGDALDEDVATAIEGCRFLWRQEYVLEPGGRILRVLVVKTAER